MSAIRALTTTQQITHQQAVNRLRELAKKERRTLAQVSQTIVDSVEAIGAN
jgi:AmiR/NasT family two-component response regulator